MINYLDTRYTGYVTDPTQLRNALADAQLPNELMLNDEAVRVYKSEPGNFVVLTDPGHTHNFTMLPDVEVTPWSDGTYAVLSIFAGLGVMMAYTLGVTAGW